MPILQLLVINDPFGEASSREESSEDFDLTPSAGKGGDNVETFNLREVVPKLTSSYISDTWARSVVSAGVK